jgi:hypothetical protein
MFVTCLSIVMLSEKVGVRRWIATLVGLVGVLIVVRPGTAAFHAAAFFPIVSALGWAFALVLTRQIAGVDRPVTTMAYSAIVGFVVLSLLVPFFWVTPTWQQVGIAVLIGISSTLGHWIVVLAYRHRRCLGAGAVHLQPTGVGERAGLRDVRGNSGSLHRAGRVHHH